MSGYVRNIKVETEFDGSKVVAFMKPILLEDTLQLRGESADAAMTYARMLPRYVTSISGVVDSEGINVPIEEIATVTYFVPLVATIMEQHMGAAKINDPTLPAAS